MSSGDAVSSPRNAETFILCPCCGSDAYQSNLLDETPYREAARSASLLRRLGASQLAADLLVRLASVRIANFLRLRWRCLECGVTFHG